MATGELRSLVAQGKIAIEGDGLDLHLKLDQVLELKNALRDRQPEMPISREEVSRGWSRQDGLIFWRGAVPPAGHVMLKAAVRDWQHFNFRLFFDVRGTVSKVGLAVGKRLFAADTTGNAVKWHAYAMEMNNGIGRIVIDDKQIFSGNLEVPFIALCGAGASELSRTNQDTVIFRGLKLERIS